MYKKAYLYPTLSSCSTAINWTTPETISHPTCILPVLYFFFIFFSIWAFLSPWGWNVNSRCLTTKFSSLCSFLMNKGWLSESPYHLLNKQITKWFKIIRWFSKLFIDDYKGGHFSIFLSATYVFSFLSWAFLFFAYFLIRSYCFSYQNLLTLYIKKLIIPSSITNNFLPMCCLTFNFHIYFLLRGIYIFYVDMSLSVFCNFSC